MRPAFAALWALDLALADVVASSRDRALGAIRLAWWREALEALDQGPAPAEPRLAAVATQLLPLGVRGAELAALEDGWLALLEPFPWGREQVEAAQGRGRVLFNIGARLLGSVGTEGAGEVWSLADVANHCSDSNSRSLLRAEAHRVLAGMREWHPARSLRPLTLLAALAAVELSGRGGGIARGWAAQSHLLFGRWPRLD